MSNRVNDIDPHKIPYHKIVFYLFSHLADCKDCQLKYTDIIMHAESDIRGEGNYAMDYAKKFGIEQWVARILTDDGREV